jgi:hypothetical protein
VGGQHGFVVQIQLGYQFSRRLTLANASHDSHEENDLLGRPLTALKDSARVQVVNRSAMFTTLNVQGAGLCSPKLSRLFYVSFALGAFQPLWMKMLKGHSALSSSSRSSVIGNSIAEVYHFHALPLHMSPGIL